MVACPDGGAGPADAEVSEEGRGPLPRPARSLRHDFDDGATAGGGWSLTSGMAKVTPTRSPELTASTNGPALAGTLTSASAGSAGFPVRLAQPPNWCRWRARFATLFEARSPDGGRRVEVRLLAWRAGRVRDRPEQRLPEPPSREQRLQAVDAHQHHGLQRHWRGSFEISVGGGPVTMATIGSGRSRPMPTAR